MKKSILNRPVSVFASYKDTTPKTVDLLAFLTSDKYAAKINELRQCNDKAQRDTIKATLPAITPSGTFTHRGESGLIEHSGVIQADIDAKDNPTIFEGANSLADYLDILNQVKTELSKLRDLAYIGLSASGRGLFILIPIAYPDRHKEHFAAIVADFKKIGINLDTAPSNVASLRGYSYDPDAYFNHNAETYTRLANIERKAPTSQRQPTKHTYPTGSEADKVKFILDQIARQSADITAGYQNWFAIGCALANEFGESGRGYFHDVSRNNSGYDYRQTDTQFTHCLKGTAAFTIATFYAIAAQHGFTFKEALQGTAHTHQKPGTASAHNDSPERHTTPTGTPQATPKAKPAQAAQTTSIRPTRQTESPQTEKVFIDSLTVDWWNYSQPKPEGWDTIGLPEGWVRVDGELCIITDNKPGALEFTPILCWHHSSDEFDKPLEKAAFAMEFERAANTRMYYGESR